MRQLLTISIVAVLVVSAGALGYQQRLGRAPMHGASAATYEHLASAIIALRATEESLVLDMLQGYHSVASKQLQAAADGTGSARVAHLEAAAKAITDIANEGNKPVQAVRQRLLRAGHHHHTDAETDEDYIWINSAEKKEMLDLASRVSRLGRSATSKDIQGAMNDLDRQFHAAIAPK